MCARTGVGALTDPATQDRRRQELLLRMRRLQAKRQDEPKPPPAPPPDVPLDTLATVTYHHRRLLEALYAKIEALTQLPTINVIVRTTQLAHVLMLVAVFIVSSSLLQLSSAKPASPFISLAYLASFSTHIGSQFWMTFVSGLALYFNLPRHDFGAVQKVLFPKYFSINSFLSLVTLVSFTKLHHLTSMKNPEILQAIALSFCFLLELTIRLYAVPTVIQLITAKTELEVAAGVGQEVGYFNPGQLMSCPYYKRLHLKFRQQHMLVAIGNIAAMACTSLHLYYLAHHWVCNTI